MLWIIFWLIHIILTGVDFISKSKIVTSGGSFKIISSNTFILHNKETSGLGDEVTFQTSHHTSVLLLIQSSLLYAMEILPVFLFKTEIF